MENALQTGAEGMMEFPSPLGSAMGMDALLKKYKEITGRNPLVSKRSVGEVLRLIIERTWRFGKEQDRFTTGMFCRGSHGVRRASISKVDFSPRTVRRAISFLEWAGLIKKDSFDDYVVITTYPIKILQRFCSQAEKRKLLPNERRAYNKCMRALYALAGHEGINWEEEDKEALPQLQSTQPPSQMGPVAKDNEEYKGEKYWYTMAEAFEKGILKDLDPPERKKKEHIKTLEEATAEAAEKARKISEKKDEKRRWNFTTVNGKLNPNRLLEYFGFLVRKHISPDAPICREAKYVGMAKNYLRAAYNSGMTDDEIREELKSIVNWWPKLQGRLLVKNWYDKKKKTMRQFEVRIGFIPDLVFVVCNRVELLALIKSIEERERLEAESREESKGKKSAADMFFGWAFQKDK